MAEKAREEANAKARLIDEEKSRAEVQRSEWEAEIPLLVGE